MSDSLEYGSRPGEPALQNRTHAPCIAAASARGGRGPAHRHGDLFIDEKILGSVHIALGRAYAECNGTNDSSFPSSPTGSCSSRRAVGEWGVVAPRSHASDAYLRPRRSEHIAAMKGYADRAYPFTASVAASGGGLGVS